jgi:RNA polymerase sigma-70 factor (ECF subfamily)
MLIDHALAEDLAQEVFLQLHHSMRALDSHRHLVFWLRQVTTRRAIDRLRQDRRARFVVLDEGLGLTAAAAEEDPLFSRHLQAMIRELAPMARAVLLLRYQEDLDPLDIADLLQMPVNTVKSHLKRSLDMLRAQLGDSDLAERDGNT